jgi:hypothetical protein
MAIDTEFVWERTYRRAGRHAVATDDAALVLDAKALPSLSALPLLRDRRSRWYCGPGPRIFADLMGAPAAACSTRRSRAPFSATGCRSVFRRSSS